MIGKSQELQVINLLNALMLITKVVHGLTETHPKFGASGSLRFRLSHTRRYRVLPDAFRSYPVAKPGGQSDGVADALRGYPEAKPGSQSDGVAKVTGKRVSCVRQTGWRVARRKFFWGKLG